MINQDKISLIDNSFQEIFKIYYQYWLNNIFLTWRWWLLVILIIVSWILWLLFRKKDSTYRLLLAGLFVAITSALLDKIGFWLSLWSYPVTVLPLMPSHILWNLSLGPILVMATIQFKPNINPFLKSVIFSLVIAFIFQPLSVLFGLYDPKVWHHYYSAPIFLVIYLIAHFLSARDKFRPLK